MATNPKSAAILGGGLTGLTAAYRLAALGHRVRLFEMTGRVGGVIATEAAEGWLCEAGPNTLLPDAPALALLHELDLEGEIIEADPAARHRYVAWRGRAVPVPLTPPALAASPLFSARAKLRFVTERFTRPVERTADVSVADFTREHFGAEALERAMQPVVSGIWAGDPGKLSTRHAFPKLWEMEQQHGSVITGQIAAAKERTARGEPPMPRIISFRRGLQTLPWALTSRLPEGTITRHAPVSRLVREGARWKVEWRHGDATREETFDVIAAALPAPALAGLPIGPAGERPLAGLGAIEHPPLATLFLGYRREQVTHPLDGFGLLIPAAERRAALGVLFSSSLFPGRAPAGCVALTVMAGGALQPAIARLGPAELLEAVRSDLRDLLGVSGEPIFQRHAFWPAAIPQYNLGYEGHLATMAACEKANPGFHLGGQARDGISLAQCLAAGEALAERAGA